jgi:hypothetical protein
MIALKECRGEAHQGNRWMPLSLFMKTGLTKYGVIKRKKHCSECEKIYRQKLYASKDRVWKDKKLEQQRMSDNLKRRREGVPELPMHIKEKRLTASYKRLENHYRFKTFIDNSELRDAVLASDKPLLQIAEECGWTTFRKKRGKKVGDSARLKRAIGILPSYTRGRKYYQYQVTVDVAERLAEALEIDSWKIGL